MLLQTYKISDIAAIQSAHYNRSNKKSYKTKKIYESKSILKRNKKCYKKVLVSIESNTFLVMKYWKFPKKSTGANTYQ